MSSRAFFALTLLLAPLAASAVVCEAGTYYSTSLASDIDKL